MALPNYDDWMALPDDEIRKMYDKRAPHTEVGVGYLREELHRRDMLASSKRVESMTDTVRRLTWVVAGLTVLNVGAAVVAVASSG